MVDFVANNRSENKVRRAPQEAMSPLFERRADKPLPARSLLDTSFRPAKPGQSGLDSKTVKELLLYVYGRTRAMNSIVYALKSSNLIEVQRVDMLDRLEIIIRNFWRVLDKCLSPSGSVQANKTTIYPFPLAGDTPSSD